MEVLGWYVLFALTTASATMYEIISPVMFELGLQEPNHNMIEYKYLSYAVFFIVSLVLAPFLLLPCLVPSVGERFKGALVMALVEKA